jgi:toxin ParE1/3/4
MDDDEPLFTLIWAESAIADLDGICSFIADHDQRAAERIGLGILEHVELLARFPFIGPAYPLGSGGSVREIVFRRIYRIFYAVAEQRRTVEVLRVWHGARSEPELPTPATA